MEPDTFFIASVDITATPLETAVSPWDVAGRPLIVERNGLEAMTQGALSHCPVCGNELKGYCAKEEGRRHLNSLLDEAYLSAIVPCGQCPEEEGGSKKVEIPWGRPGTGCTQLFDVLVLALVRQMPFKAAAAMFANCKGTDLAFGSFAVDPAGGTLLISTAGALTPSGTIHVVSASTHSAATFNIGGAASASYTIGLPATITLTGPGTDIIVDTLTTALVSTNVITPGAATLPVAGTDTLLVGGTATLGAGQTVGSYSGTFSATVNYN